MISDTHFGIYLNNLEKWQSMMEEYFYNFFIPYLRKNAKDGDILIHLGDLFDNRTSVPIITSNKVEKILKEISNILPIHILIGNHDNFNKGSSNEVNSVRIFSYINKNIFVYETTNSIQVFDKKLVLIPWVEKRIDLIKELSNNPGDYLFCHSDLNGCRMHLNSVAHRNPDKIDVSEFKGYTHVFSGHIHIRQENENFTFVGSPYQMDRNDMNDQKGITILDLISGKIDFVPNTHSPIFKKFMVLKEDDIDRLDTLVGSKDYIDLFVSNNLLISNRKLRRKLEILLEKGSFSSVEYIDDIISKDEVEENKEEALEISVALDYENYIQEYIDKQKYESDKFKTGIRKEFDEIIRIYNENFRTKSN